MKHKISAVIPFCSNDYRFFHECVDNLLPICDKIVISIADKFWTGGEENQEILDKVREYASSNPQLIIKEFKISDDKDAWFNEEKARKVGIYALMYTDAEYILFVDTDEIVETKRMEEWLDEGYYKKYNTVQIGCYWYWREKKYQATTYETGPITLMSVESAWEWYNSKAVIQGRAIMGHKTMYGAMHKDNKPFFHHYSWVRTKEEMLKKTASWGISKDRNWPDLVEEEFSRPFNGEDFLHNYQYKVLEE